ncbi:MAG: hypothetical protein GC206_09860 [Alphaproteobacteria bacterium]|nr:hypothetical protein [Alphaproteobacteria bacterium]
MKSTVLALATVALAPLLAGEAFACAARLPSAAPPAEAAVDPFSPYQTVIDLPIMLEIDGECDGVELVAHSPAGAGDRALRGPGGAIEYRLTAPSGPTLRNTRDPGGGVHILRGGPMALRATIGDAASALAPGAYEDDVELSLYDRRSGALLSGPLNVVVRADIAPRVQANLAGLARGGNATMDFGALEPGERQRVMLQVRANTQVSIALESENGGELKLDAAPGAPGVGYTLTFDGERGGAAPWRFSRTPPLTLRGAAYPIEIQIGATEGRFAGRYRDVVTITVIPY